MATQVGIWMDKRIAKIVTLENGNSAFSIVESDVEEFHPKGGSGTRMKGGPQDVVQDSKYTERQKHQLKNYFDDIIDQLPELDELIVIGPSQTGIHFATELEHRHKALREKLIDVLKADNMTDNQLKAWFEDFFEKVSMH